jgi:hypothetical protein
MVVRVLDATASDFAGMDALDLAESIRIAEGRTLSVEVNCTDQPPVDGVTHAELAAGMGADILLLDRYSPLKPVILGAPEGVINSQSPLAGLKALIGRPLGINLLVGSRIPPEKAGRAFNPEIAAVALEQGADILFLINQPTYGGGLAQMEAAADWVRTNDQGRLMPVAVTSAFTPPPRNLQDVELFGDNIKALVQAGTMGIGLPMPGSKQGWLLDTTARLVDIIHAEGALAWSILTGSVEGSPREVMFSLALQAKMLGFDVHRLDEAGLSGMPTPENILAYSLAIRGERHTYRRMALSIRR